MCVQNRIIDGVPCLCCNAYACCVDSPSTFLTGCCIHTALHFLTSRMLHPCIVRCLQTVIILTVCMNKLVCHSQNKTKYKDRNSWESRSLSIKPYCKWPSSSMTDCHYFHERFHILLLILEAKTTNKHGISKNISSTIMWNKQFTTQETVKKNTTEKVTLGKACHNLKTSIQIMLYLN